MDKSQNIYFAAKSPDDTANILLNKANAWFSGLEANGYLDKVRMMWAAYYGAYYTDFSNGHSITFGGEQGELANIAINHIRNLGQHILVMITANRPAFDARATNTDQKSLVQTRLANNLLDYYMREKRLEDYLKNAVESAIALGTGYIKMEWNSTAGEVYDFNEETQTEIREGDVEFSNLSPFDVIVDGNREDQKHDWILCRSKKNRYDIMAKYPEYKDKILSLPSVNDYANFSFDTFYDETDLIFVYEFYHRRSEAMPDGRYLLFLSKDVNLIDSPMPYRNLPIYRISPSNILGTPYGYTPLFDILPIQDAINSEYSTILTNHNAFGVQNILVPRGADVSISELSGGLNIIEANQSAGEIRPLNLTNTPEEIFNFVKMLEQAAETISGVNSVARGNPEASLKSGTALALVQSMSLQFMSGLQQSYIQLIEDVGSGLISMLRDFAEVPRIAMIVGKKNQTQMQEFVGDDLSNVNRVIVDVGNPLSKTTAGRVQMASELLQMGLIKTSEQYFNVMNTGNLDTMTEDTQSELDLIRKENENLVSGDPVIAMITDQHGMHIREHKYVLNDPMLRFDPELVKRCTAHIQEHIDLLKSTDPDLLRIINEQPLSPPGGTPANQPPQNVPPGSAQGIPPEMMQPAQMAPQVGQPGMPPMPTPPPPFEQMPINPQDMLPQQ